jgi:hypothetical protein
VTASSTHGLELRGLLVGRNFAQTKSQAAVHRTSVWADR